MTDELTSTEIIRLASLKKLNDGSEWVERAINSTLANYQKAMHNGDWVFCVYWGPNLCYVVDKHSVVDGPFTREEGHDLINAMLEAMQGVNNGE